MTKFLQKLVENEIVKEAKEDVDIDDLSLVKAEHRELVAIYSAQVL